MGLGRLVEQRCKLNKEVVLGKARDWKKDGESVGVNLIEKDGDTLICEKDGFIFCFLISEELS